MIQDKRPADAAGKPAEEAQGPERDTELRLRHPVKSPMDLEERREAARKARRPQKPDAEI
jgi:hypothetical protein